MNLTPGALDRIRILLNIFEVFLKIADQLSLCGVQRSDPQVLALDSSAYSRY